MDRVSTVRILIADDHLLFREGLRNLISTQPDLEVVGLAADGDEAVKLVCELKPDVLLLDLAMPKYPGLQALRQVCELSHPVRTIILTASIEKAQLAEAVQLGARGVLLKTSAVELLAESIRKVQNGDHWVSHESPSDLVQAMRSLLTQPVNRTTQNGFKLTPRELEVTQAIVAGYTNKDIATNFLISEQTVKHHLTNIFDKLGVSNRLELVLFTIEHHLI